MCLVLRLYLHHIVLLSIVIVMPKLSLNKKKPSYIYTISYYIYLCIGAYFLSCSNWLIVTRFKFGFKSFHAFFSFFFFLYFFFSCYEYLQDR